MGLWWWVYPILKLECLSLVMLKKGDRPSEKAMCSVDLALCNTGSFRLIASISLKDSIHVKLLEWSLAWASLMQVLAINISQWSMTPTHQLKTTGGGGKAKMKRMQNHHCLWAVSFPHEFNSLLFSYTKVHCPVSSWAPAPRGVGKHISLANWQIGHVNYLLRPFSFSVGRHLFEVSKLLLSFSPWQ